MKKTLIVMLLLLIGTIVFTPVVLADESGEENVQKTVVTEKTAVITENGIQAISPQEGVKRINTALLSAYNAGASVVPNLALIALLVGTIMAMFAAALSLEKILKISLLGMAVVLIAVVIVYAGPFLTALAKGFGEGL